MAFPWDKRPRIYKTFDNGGYYSYDVIVWEFHQIEEQSVPPYTPTPHIFDTKTVESGVDANRFIIEYAAKVQMRENIDGTYVRLGLENSYDGGSTWYSVEYQSVTSNNWTWEHILFGWGVDTILTGYTAIIYRLIGYHLGCTIDGRIKNLKFWSTIFY